MFERLRAMIRKEIIQLTRDKRSLIFTIFLPLLIVGLFGLAHSGEATDIKIVVVDEDQSYYSMLLIQYLQSDYRFIITRYLHSYSEGRYYVSEGLVRAAIVIPKDFGKLIEANTQTYVVLILDSTSVTLPAHIIGAVNDIIARFSDAVARESLARGKYIHPQVSTVIEYVPCELKVVDIIGPAIMGIMVQQVPLTLAALSIVREREKGTMEKLLSTPITRYDIIFGKLIPLCFTGIIVGVLCLFLTIALGGINRGRLLDIIIASLFLSLAALALGIFLSVISRTQLQAVQASTFFLIATFLFSGFIFPPEIMRWFVRPVIYAMPLYYFFLVITDIMIRGKTLVETLDQIACLALYAVILLLIGLRLLSSRIG